MLTAASVVCWWLRSTNSERRASGREQIACPNETKHKSNKPRCGLRHARISLSRFDFSFAPSTPRKPTSQRAICLSISIYLYIYIYAPHKDTFDAGSIMAQSKDPFYQVKQCVRVLLLARARASCTNTHSHTRSRCSCTVAWCWLESFRDVSSSVAGITQLFEQWKQLAASKTAQSSDEFIWTEDELKTGVNSIEWDLQDLEEAVNILAYLVLMCR